MFVLEREASLVCVGRNVLAQKGARVTLGSLVAPGHSCSRPLPCQVDERI